MKRMPFLPLALLIVSTQALAAAGPQAPLAPPQIRSNSIDWQRVALEERIQAKLRSALGLSVPDEKFIVTVAITLKPRVAEIDPATGKPRPDRPGIARRERAPLGKLDLDAPLWVVEDENGNESPLSFAPERNLFEEIQDVKINIYLDQSIPEARVALIKQIATSLTASAGPTSPSITVERTDLAKKESTILPGSPAAKAEFAEFARDFQTPIALITVALIVCGFFTAFGIIVFAGLRKLAARRLAIMEAKDSREEQIQRQQQEALLRQQLTASGPASTDGSADKEIELDEPAERGFDRLKLLVREAPDRVASLIKQWTRNPMGGAKDALAAIPQILKTEELLQVFKYLNTEDRREWRKYLGQDVSPTFRRKVDLFLSSQIIENLLVPAPQMDPEFKELFDQVKVAEAVEVANEDPEIGAVLIALLPSAQAARIFSLLSAERANEITVTSLKLTDAEIQRRVPRLKQVLRGLRDRHGVLPFVSRATEFLREAGPEQEAAIFNALSETGDYAALETAARQYFPAELISRLPVKILRDCMEALSIEKRAELILSRADEEKTWLLGALGKPGTKAREFIDLELKQLEMDQTRVRRAERNRDLLWKNFTETCRAMIRNNPQTAELAETLLSDWIALKTNGATGAMGSAGAA
jgi:hypothetical protein